MKFNNVLVSEEIAAKNPSRLFVFADARSGSTWLINTLNSHPEISMLEEILNPDYKQICQDEPTQPLLSDKKYSFEFIENHICNLGGKYQGVKILFPQAIRFLDFYEFILNYRNSYFILLTRENIVQAELSGMIANKHARWHLLEQKDKQKVNINPLFFRERLQWRIMTRQFCLNIINSYCPNVLQFNYENLFDNPGHHLQMISGFLKVDDKHFIKSREVKSNPFLLEDLIENYVEFFNFFKDIPEYSGMFQ